MHRRTHKNFWTQTETQVYQSVMISLVLGPSFASPTSSPSNPQNPLTETQLGSSAGLRCLAVEFDYQFVNLFALVALPVLVLLSSWYLVICHIPN